MYNVQNIFFILLFWDDKSEFRAFWRPHPLLADGKRPRTRTISSHKRIGISICACYGLNERRALPSTTCQSECRRPSIGRLCSAGGVYKRRDDRSNSPQNSTIDNTINLRVYYMIINPVSWHHYIIHILYEFISDRVVYVLIHFIRCTGFTNRCKRSILKLKMIRTARDNLRSLAGCTWRKKSVRKKIKLNYFFFR